MASAVPEKNLECAVCLEQFKEPKVLPCLHTYCKRCLEKLLKKQGPDHVITCPECRQDAKIADGNVGNLQPNFWVTNFMTLLSMQDSTSSGKSVICELCDSGDPAVSRCTNCRVFLCKFCETAHKRMNIFKGHQILSLAEVQKLGSKALVKPAFCGKHVGEILKLFCETCQATICRDCTIVDHRDHKYNFVADVAERERNNVQAILQDTKAKGSVIEEGLKAVETMGSRVEARIAEVSKEVDVFFDEQVKALKHLQTNLQNEVRIQGKAKLKELWGQTEVLTLSLAQLRSSAEFAERALADGDDMELLNVKQQLVERLTQLNALQYQCKPCKNDYLALQVKKTVRGMGEMVTVLYMPVDPAKCVLRMVGGEEGVLYQTLAGQPVDFTLVIKDGTAGCKPGNNCAVRASVTHSREANVIQELPVGSLGDGSYSFSCKPETDGVCTLVVTVDGEHVHGSPFTWKVKPEVRNMDQIRLLTGSTEEEKGNRGLHCWKLKFQGSHKRVEIGVRWNFFFEAETRRSTWCCKVKGPRYLCSRSEYPNTACITSIEEGDIFSLYLNYDARKLFIYNQRSKQSELFTEVGREIIGPVISPSCGFRGSSEGFVNAFTLDI